MPPYRYRVLRTTALIVLIVGVVPVHGEETTERAVAVALPPFEVLGEAEAEVAIAISGTLVTLLEADPSVQVTSAASDSAEYVIKGLIYAESQRKFATLQLLNAKTDQLVWSENYDYTNVLPEMMGSDVLKALRLAADPRR